VTVDAVTARSASLLLAEVVLKRSEGVARMDAKVFVERWLKESDVKREVPKE